MEPSMNGHDHNDDYTAHLCIWIHVERKGFNVNKQRKTVKAAHYGAWNIWTWVDSQFADAEPLQNTEGNIAPSDTKGSFLMSHTVYLALLISSCMSHLVYSTNTCLLGNIFQNVPFIYIPHISNSVGDPWWQQWFSYGNELIWVKKYLKMWNFN